MYFVYVSDRVGRAAVEARLCALCVSVPFFLLPTQADCSLLRAALAEVVDPLLGRGGPVEQFFGLEEQAQLAGGGLGGVGAVDEVEGVAHPVVAPDRPGLGLGAEG